MEYVGLRKTESSMNIAKYFQVAVFEKFHFISTSFQRISFDILHENAVLGCVTLETLNRKVLFSRTQVRRRRRAKMSLR